MCSFTRKKMVTCTLVVVFEVYVSKENNSVANSNSGYGYLISANGSKFCSHCFVVKGAKTYNTLDEFGFISIELNQWFKCMYCPKACTKFGLWFKLIFHFSKKKVIIVWEHKFMSQEEVVVVFPLLINACMDVNIHRMSFANKQPRYREMCQHRKEVEKDILIP